MGEDYIRAWLVLSSHLSEIENRHTILPGLVREPLQQHLYKVKALHKRDLALRERAPWRSPDAIERKYPIAKREWGWQRSRAARPFAAVVTDSRLNQS